MKEYFDFKGQVALVTGCSGGLGVQMAKALASQGCNIVPIARRMEKLEEVAAELRAAYGVEVLPIKCDITSTEQVEATVKQALAHFGRIDVVINNAGTGAVAPAEDITDAQFEGEMQIDLFGTFRVARAAAKYAMIPAGYGRVINIASIYGLVGNTAIPTIAYHSTKGAVVNFTRGAAAELAKDGITVNAICPGYFYTELTTDTLNTEYFQNFAKQSVPMARYGNGGELNSAAVFLGAEESSYVTGQIIAVDGGYTCV